MAGPVLLDTCAAIWLMGGDPLSVPSQTAMRSARTENLGIYLSPFTAWEIGTLVAKGRLHLTLSPEAWFETLLAMPASDWQHLLPICSSVQLHYREYHSETPQIES